MDTHVRTGDLLKVAVRNPTSAPHEIRYRYEMPKGFDDGEQAQAEKKVMLWKGAI